MRSPHSPRASGRRLFPENPIATRLVALLRSSGWRVDQAPDSKAPFGPDLVLKRDSLRYVVELQVAREARHALIEGLFASALLQAQAFAREMNARPLAIVAAPRISQRMGTELATYANRFAGGAAWGYMDDEGAIKLHGEGLEGIETKRGAHRASGTENLAQRRADPLSDLGQWMVKVLLAPRLDPKHLAAPRADILSASDLARMGGVSLPTAARQLMELRRLGYLEQDRRSLRLVRIGDLLRDWRAASAARATEVKTRWLVPQRDLVAQLRLALAWRPSRSQVERQRPSGQTAARGAESPRACLALFAASERLGFGFVRGAPQHIYLEDLSSESLEKLGLIPAENGERTDVIVRKPRYPESVFRAAVESDDCAVADLLQCWLDVYRHPARGDELAQQIWRRVIEPRLLAQHPS